MYLVPEVVWEEAKDSASGFDKNLFRYRSASSPQQVSDIRLYRLREQFKDYSPFKSFFWVSYGILVLRVASLPLPWNHYKCHKIIRSISSTVIRAR
jgi:hypothetical protein